VHVPALIIKPLIVFVVVAAVIAPVVVSVTPVIFLLNTGVVPTNGRTIRDAMQFTFVVMPVGDSDVQLIPFDDLAIAPTLASDCPPTIHWYPSQQEHPIPYSRPVIICEATDVQVIPSVDIATTPAPPLVTPPASQ
jgi:hypothetical protein